MRIGRLHWILGTRIDVMGRANAWGETGGASFARECGLPAVIVRIAHTYGPTMDVGRASRGFASFVKKRYRHVE